MANPQNRMYASPPMYYPQDPETILRYISVEIPANNTTGKFAFPNNNELNGMRILGISFPANPNTDMVAPSGNAVVADACVAATYVEIRRNSDNIIYQTPARFLQETDGDRSVRPINIAGFNPQTSFLVVADTTTYQITESFVITVIYTDK